MSIRGESVALDVACEAVEKGDKEEQVIENEEEAEHVKEENKKKYRFYEIVRNFSNACNYLKSGELTTILSEADHLCETGHEFRNLFRENSLGTNDSRRVFRNKVIDLMSTNFCRFAENSPRDLLFWTAVKFDLDALRSLLENLPSEAFVETHASDSVIVFALKYGDVVKEHFFACMKLLIDAGADMKTYDFKGKSAIDYVAQLSKVFKNDSTTLEALKNVAQLLLNKGIYRSENKDTEEFLNKVMHLNAYEYVKMDDKCTLFYLLSTNQPQNILEVAGIKNYVNEEFQGWTLLQFFSRRSDKMAPIVQILLEGGADPNKKINSNQLTALQLAASNSNQIIFEQLLKNTNTRVTKDEFNTFVQWRLGPMKAKLFELLLESNKLEVDWLYEKKGNTPLHYAVFFSHKKAIQLLLKRNSSLIAKNKMNKSVLDIIDPVDLETYFDSCLVLDNWRSQFSDNKYKMNFRFNCLVNRSSEVEPLKAEDEVKTALVGGTTKTTSTRYKEMKVVSQIGRQANLEYLLTHPLIDTFLALKWYRIKTYLWIVLAFQALIFLSLSVLFYRLPYSSPFEYYLCVFVGLINMLSKGRIFLLFKLKNKRPEFVVFNEVSLHASVEILLVVTTIGGIFQAPFRAFLFIEMAISFLLTMGYHPKLSKWSIMLQTVFRTFTLLFVFFSLLILAFGVGFHLLFPNGGLFTNFFTAIFKTFIMTTGEFNISEETDFSYAAFGGYLLYVIFAMSMSLVIVNFWTGVAVSDIERIEKNSETNASKNVIKFMNFVEFLYSFLIIKRLLPSPFLFSTKTDDTGREKKYEIHFHVNKRRQFESNEVTDLPQRMDGDCFNKIKQQYDKLTKVSVDKITLEKLEEMTKILNQIKEAQHFCCGQGEREERKPRKNYNERKNK